MPRMSRDNALQTITDLIYGGAHTGEPLERLSPLFEALRTVLPFSSGVFLPIDPAGWVLRAGYAHDHDPRLVHLYLAHFEALPM